MIKEAYLLNRFHNHSPLCNSEGATMVEFAFALIIIIMLFGAIFDIGLGVHRYAMLKQITNESTRQIAARLQTHRDCSFVKTYLKNTASPMLTNHLSPGSSPRWKTEWESVGSGLLFPVFRLHSSVNMKCYFICNLLPKGLPIRTSSEIVIERKGIGIGGQGCSPISI